MFPPLLICTGLQDGEKKKKLIEKSPVYSLVETAGPPVLRSRSFLTNDPALIVLFGQLRATTLQTLAGASKVTPKVERDFVLHCARVYCRMGCDLLGLDLGEFVWMWVGDEKSGGDR